MARADPRIDAVRGTVAVQRRGPLVYCAESVDLREGDEVDAIRVGTSVDPEDGPGDTDDSVGTVVVAGEVAVPTGDGGAAWPYRPGAPVAASVPGAREALTCTWLNGSMGALP